MIVSAVYALLGHSSNCHIDSEITEEHTSIVFQKFDKLHRGYVTLQDFIKLCLEVKNFFDKNRRKPRFFPRIQSSFNRLKLYV